MVFVKFPIGKVLRVCKEGLLIPTIHTQSVIVILFIAKNLLNYRAIFPGRNIYTGLLDFPEFVETSGTPYVCDGVTARVS